VTRRALLLLLGGLALPLVAVACGIGWLYLLKSGHLLAIGPRVKGALALQQLALGDAQPLARTLAAWLAAGVAAGALLRALDRRAATRLLPAFAIGSAACLVAAGAASDALANNLPLSGQFASQLPSTQLAVALGALLAAAVAGMLATGAVVRR
jgi:hypothetical protein